MTETNALSVDAVRQKQNHDHSIELIAKSTHVEVDRIRELYDAEIARLSADARIKTFVAVLATRFVRENLTQHA
jgi:hypothetical protein